MTNTHPPYWKKACTELSRADPVMKKLIRTYKGELMRGRGDAFFTLARAIVGQQISVKAAESVWRKLETAMARVSQSETIGPSTLTHVDPPIVRLRRTRGIAKNITPYSILSASDTDLRACGLSGQKVRYLKSLATHFLDHPRPAWEKMSDEEVVQFLLPIKGIGRWTAEMFLIFHLMRPDVYPLDDIGLQKAIFKHYNQGKPLTRAQLKKMGERWSPWRSVATWYFWRSLDPLPVEY